MAPFYVCKMVEIHHQKKFSYIIKFILVFKKNKNYSDFKYWTLKFSNKFDVGIFFCLRLELFLIFYSLGVTFFIFNYFISNIWQFLCCLHFPLNFHKFFHFLSTRIAKLGKFETKQNVGWGAKGFNSTIECQNFIKLCYFYFYNRNENKIIFLHHKYNDFFQVV